MNQKVKDLIQLTVKNMIDKSSSNNKLNKFRKTHEKKIHFIPIRYRIFGGVLQSMNIQFGNFIEELMAVLVSNEKRFEIIENLSGKKNKQFSLSKANDDRIDSYITRCQTEQVNIDVEFPQLLSDIIACDDKTQLKFDHDIDLIFRNKTTGVYYYLEIKYNDDHDTGKFVDINRKFIKTYAYLVNELKITNSNQLVPILFFFNNKKMKGNIYIPEETNIKRGQKFFDEFLSVEYSQVDKYMSDLSESEEVVETFHELHRKVMKL